MASRGPRRKVPLLLDENLETAFTEDLKSVNDFLVTVGRAGASDEELWAQARRDRLVLVTGDLDFWDDRRFPLAQSPGLVVLRGRSAEDRTQSFALTVIRFDLVRAFGHFPTLLGGMKLKASRTDVTKEVLGWHGRGEPCHERANHGGAES